MDNKDKDKAKGKAKNTTIKPCPFSGMKCPCGCGLTYGGVCLRPHPSISCINGLRKANVIM